MHGRVRDIEVVEVAGAVRHQELTVDRNGGGPRGAGERVLVEELAGRGVDGGEAALRVGGIHDSVVQSRGAQEPTIGLVAAELD